MAVSFPNHSSSLVTLGYLVVLTLVSFATFFSNLPSAVYVSAVMGLALVKSRMILLRYMEADLAPGARGVWRKIYEAWILVVVLTVVLGKGVIDGWSWGG